jgi:hypothetical protein
MTTQVTAAQIATVRRMVAEPATTTYSDALITTFIEAYPLQDERGELPYTWSSATPPAQVVNDRWVATYDLNAAAADIWQEKAGSLAALYDFAADGGNYSRSQAFEQAMKQARYFRARKRPASAQMIKFPDEGTGSDVSYQWIGNLPEPLDP